MPFFTDGGVGLTGREIPDGRGRGRRCLRRRPAMFYAMQVSGAVARSVGDSKTTVLTKAGGVREAINNETRSQNLTEADEADKIL